MEDKNIRFSACKPSQKTTLSLMKFLKSVKVLDELQDTQNIER